MYKCIRHLIQKYDLYLAELLYLRLHDSRTAVLMNRLLQCHFFFLREKNKNKKIKKSVLVFPKLGNYQNDLIHNKLQ